MSENLLFHFNEIAFVGGQNVGKTDLIIRLIQQMSKFSIKRVKYHKSSKKNDLELSYINNLDHDFLFIESHHLDIEIPKFIVLKNLDDSKELEVLKRHENGEIKNVLAFICPDRTQFRKLNNLPVFHPDQIAGLEYFIQNYFLKSFNERKINTLLISNNSIDKINEETPLMKKCLSFSDKIILSEKFSSNLLELKSITKIKKNFFNLNYFEDLITLQKIYLNSSWLVINVDHHLCNEENIDKILLKRNPFKVATKLSLDSNSDIQDALWIFEPKSIKFLLESFILNNEKSHSYFNNLNIENKILENLNKTIDLNHNLKSNNLKLNESGLS